MSQPDQDHPRRATLDDVDEVVRLGGLMFESLGHREQDWKPRSREVMREGFEGGRIAAFVVDHPEMPGQLICSAVGVTWRRLPTPMNSSGRGGYVQYVWTDPGHRGRGLARRTMESLLGWFREEGVDDVDLHASPAGEPLYRSMGFRPTEHPALRLLTGPRAAR